MVGHRSDIVAILVRRVAWLYTFDFETPDPHRFDKVDGPMPGDPIPTDGCLIELEKEATAKKAVASKATAASDKAAAKAEAAAAAAKS